ncbi:MAG: DegV family protein [Velocimicrobium sp.]
MEYQIISDGSCDIRTELAKEMGIKIVPFYVTFDEVVYKKEVEEISIREFYEQMVENPKQFPKSSLPSIGDFQDAFREFVEQEIPIICVCITTKFSGSYNAAMNAKQIMQEEHPNAKITIIDSQINTVLQGIYVLEAAKLQVAGKSYEETIHYLEANRDSGRILFTIANIDYLKNGGRIGKLMGLAGSTLGIKPLIELKEGEIYPFGISRSREKSKKKLMEQLKLHFEKIKENADNYSVVVGFGYDLEEAKLFRDALLVSMQTYCSINEIPIFQIGATIGVHTGPHPIGVAIIRKSIL